MEIFPLICGDDTDTNTVSSTCFSYICQKVYKRITIALHVCCSVMFILFLLIVVYNDFFPFPLCAVGIYEEAMATFLSGKRKWNLFYILSLILIYCHTWTSCLIVTFVSIILLMMPVRLTMSPYVI